MLVKGKLYKQKFDLDGESFNDIVYNKIFIPKDSIGFYIGSNQIDLDTLEMTFIIGTKMVSYIFYTDYKQFKIKDIFEELI